MLYNALISVISLTCQDWTSTFNNYNNACNKALNAYTFNLKSEADQADQRLLTEINTKVNTKEPYFIFVGVATKTALDKELQYSFKPAKLSIDRIGINSNFNKSSITFSWELP